MTDAPYRRRHLLRERNERLLSVEEPSPGRLWPVLVLCFVVPVAVLFIIHSILKVFPMGNNSVLVLDLNAQYIYYFEKFRDIITSGDSILYSFNRSLGGEFLGIFAYYLSSPFSILVALFPKESMTEAIYLIILLKAGFSGMTFGFFLRKTRNMKLSHTVMFSSMYALCAFAVVMQHNVMWTDNIIALPLILYSIDMLITRGRFVMYTITLTWCIVSNFYIGYMMCLFILVWFFVRYFTLNRAERNPHGKKAHFLRTLLLIGLSSAAAVLASAVIILPVYYSLSFGKLTFSTPNWTPKQLYEWLDLLTKSFFGSYDSVRPEGMPFTYCGVIALVLAPLYFFSRKIPVRRKVAMGIMLTLFIFSFNFNVLDFIWHGFQRPNWLNARFSFIFVGLIVIMAADAFRNLRNIGFKAPLATGGLALLLLVILAKNGYDNLPTFEGVWANIGLIIIMTGLTAYYARIPYRENKKRITGIVLCCLTVFEMGANGLLMLTSLDKDVVISTRDSYRNVIDKYREATELYRDDESFYRSEKLVHRNKNDNYALDIYGLSNSTSTLNAKVVALLQQFGYSSRSHWTYYSGSTAPSDAFFGIKYVMADESDTKPVMSYIHDCYDKIGTTEQGIDVYENPYALGIAFSAKKDAAGYDTPYIPLPDGSYDIYMNPFEYMNGLFSALTGEECRIWTQAFLEDTRTEYVNRSTTTGHRGYKPDGSGETGKVIYTVEALSDDTLYVYFPSQYPRKAGLYLNGAKLCNYFDDAKNNSIWQLGSFEEGEKITVELRLTTDSLYVRNDTEFFYHFNEDEFIKAATALKDGSMEAYSDVDHHITGTVTVPEGDGMMFTTIPYDKYWEVYVDGERTETYAVLDETLLAFDITPGPHEIEFRYESEYAKLGLILSACGILLFLVMCIPVLVKFILKKRGKYRDKDLHPVPAHPDVPARDRDYPVMPYDPADLYGPEGFGDPEDFDPGPDGDEDAEDGSEKDLPDAQENETSPDEKEERTSDEDVIHAEEPDELSDTPGPSDSENVVISWTENGEKDSGTINTPGPDSGSDSVDMNSHHAFDEEETGL